MNEPNYIWSDGLLECETSYPWGHAVREVRGSNRGHGVFHPDKATGKVFTTEYAIYYRL